MAHRILPLLALAVLALSCQCTGTPVRAFGTLQATPAELRFDGVVVGSTRALRLTVRNAGRATLTLTDFTLANDSRSAFSLDGAAAGALQGGAERELTVTYAARGRGNDLALLRIAHDGDNGPETVVPLFGSSPEGTCTDPSCGAGEVCVQGRCYPLDCQPACAATEVCVEGQCLAPGRCAGVTCLSPPTCTTGPGRCDPATGACVYPAADAGTSCDDGDRCNGVSTCAGGACRPGVPVACTAPPECRVAAGATCAPTTGACTYPEADAGTSCDDGDRCNGVSTCAGGACRPGVPVACTAPPECRVAAGATCAPTTGDCTYPAASDGTVCGAGVCSGGACVQCNTAADCASTVDNSAGCFFVECLANHTCSATLRHDGQAFRGSPWKVDPVFTAERKIADNATPRKVLFDGTNFMVFLAAGPSRFGVRVSRAGADLGTTPPFDPATEDVAFASDGGVKRYLAVGVVPAGTPPAGALPYDAIAGTLMDETGAAVGSKVLLLSDDGSVCASAGGDGTMSGPRVAGSSGQFMVWAQARCYFARGATVSLSGAQVSQLATLVGIPAIRPSFPRVFGGPSGFAVTFKDLTTGGGVVEISGAPLALSASGSLTPALVAPFGWGGTAVGWGGPALVRGSAGYLFAYNDLTSGPIRARTLAATLQSPSAEVVLAGSYASSGSAELWSPELGFDGTNYLAVSADRAHQLPGQRLTASGGLLDSNTAPMLLTPSDGLLETNPSLGFDRAGRYLIAYRKPDGHTWVRLFSTCP